MTKSIVDLTKEAREMYLDREQSERDLIFYVAKMSDEEHLALILAYQNIMNEGIDERK